MQSQGIKLDISAQIVGYLASLKKLKLMAQNIDLGSALGKSISTAIKSAEGQLKNLQKNPAPIVKNDAQIDNVLNKSNQLGLAISNIGTMMQSITGLNLNFGALGEQFTSLIQKIGELQGKLDESKATGLQDAIKNSSELKTIFLALGVSIDKITTKNGGEILAKGLSKAQSEALKLTQITEAAKAAMESQQATVDSLKNNLFLGKDFDAKAFSNQISGIFVPDKIITPLKRDQFEDQIRDLIYKNIHLTDGIKASNLVDQLVGNLTADPEKMSAQFKMFFHNLAQYAELGEKEISSKILQGRSIKDIFNSLFEVDSATLLKSKQLLQDKLTQIADGLDSKTLGSLRGKIDTAQTGELFKKVQEQVITAMYQANEKIKKEYLKATNELLEFKQKYQEALMNQGKADNRVQAIQQGSQQYNNIVQNLEQKLKSKLVLIADLKELLKQMSEGKAAEIRQGSKDVFNVASQFNFGADAAAKYKIQLEQVQAKLQMIGKIQGVVQRWFSIYAAVRMVSNAIKLVISTIRLLDKTITEIAIVTDMDQNDLWGQMDQYTNLANKYAASISGVYKVSQLYYQQGLQTNDVMALTEQTLKMARISGLDYLAATNYMTNAVRSFKMLMTDAQQVVDTYSAIAASSATSVSELATAMSKTASSAQAVGSSFQNTTAMMAVMIEATRESAENIGSAMKSIISRYGEMTSDPSKMTDSEGLEMSLNRVDKALKTVGITLQTAEGQFRDFDDVIMELASKWNTLDTNTQRYIATIMAGNRQQSRFLALVSSYDRLKEETLIANDSEDASQLQMLSALLGVEGKILRVHTSIQALYTDTGIQNFYKGLLDFANNYTRSLSNLPELFNFPINGIGKFVAQFATLGLVVTKGFKAIKTAMMNGKTEVNAYVKVANGLHLTILLQAMLLRLALKKTLAQQALAAAKEKGLLVLNQEEANNNAQYQAALAAQKKMQQLQRRQKISMGLSMAGMATSMAATNIDLKKNPVLKGTLTGVGGILSSVGMGMMISGPAGWIIGILSAIPSILLTISTIWPSAEKRLQQLKETAELANNEALKKKSETKSLSNQITLLRKLLEARYDSVLALLAYYLAANKLGLTYPNLISSMDLAGNVTIDLYAALLELKNIRALGVAAALAAAKAEYELKKQQLEDATKKLLGVRVETENLLFPIETFLEEYAHEVFGSLQEFFKEAGIDEETFKKGFFDSFSNLYSIEDVGQVVDQYLSQFLGNSYIDDEGFNSVQNKYGNLLETFIRGVNGKYPTNNFLKALLGMYGEKDENYKIFETIISILEDETRDNSEIAAELAKLEKTENPIGKILLDYFTNYSQSYQAVALAKYNTAVAKRSGLSRVVGQQLIGVGGYASLMLGIQQILVGLLLSYAENQGEGFDFGKWLNNEDINGVDKPEEVLSKLMDSWQSFWNNLEDSQKAAFNNLTKNTSIYSETLFKQRLLDIFPFLREDDNLLASILKGFYTEDTYDLTYFTKRYKSGRENTSLSKVMLDLIEDGDNKLFKTIGSSELKAINKYYDNVLAMIKGGTITEGTGEKLLENYIGFANAIATADLTSLDRLKVLAALYRWDGTLDGLIQIGQLLKDLGVNIDTENWKSYKELLQITPVNLVTLYSLLVTKATGLLEDFEKALSNASKGMDAKLAVKMALKLGVTLTDFRFESGKYYFDDILLIKEKYLTDYDEFLQQLDERYKKLAGTGIDGEGGRLREISQSGKTSFDYIKKISLLGEKYNWTAEKIRNTSIIVLQNAFDFSEEQASLLYQLYTQYAKLYEEAGNLEEGTTLTDYVIKKLSQERADYLKIINLYVLYQANSFILKTGNITAFVESVLGKDKPEAADAAIQNILSGNFSQLGPEFSQYIEDLATWYKNTNKAAYDAAIKSLQGLGPQKIEVTDVNRSFLQQIGAKDATGLQITSETRFAWLDLTNYTKDQIIELQNDIINSTLSMALKKKYLSDIHDSQYSTKISNVFGNMIKDYREIEYKTLLDVAESLGLNINDMIKSFGIDFNAKTGRFSMTAKLARRMALTSFIKDGDIRKYNLWIAQINKQLREESAESILALAIENYNTLTLENIQAIANIFGYTYLYVEQFIVKKNADGSYRLDLSTIQDMILSGKMTVTTKISLLIAKQIDDIITNATDVVSNQTSGISSIASMQQYITTLDNLGIRQIGKLQININTLFEWNENLHKYVLSNTGILSQIVATMMQIGSYSGLYLEFAQQLLRDIPRQMALQIDPSLLLFDGKTDSEIDRNILTFKKSVEDYNAYIEQLGGQLIDWEEIYRAITSGGVEGVVAAKTIADISGEAMSADDIKAFYQARVNTLMNIALLITYSVGSIVSKLTANVLNQVQPNTAILLADGQYLIQTAVNLVEAYHKIYEELINSGNATVLQLNQIKALLLLSKTGADAVLALGSAALMTYTQFADILTSKGYLLSEELLNNLLNMNIVQQIGGGKIRITDFSRFADAMGWLKSSELYISALKTYNQAMVDLNNKIARNIGEEVNGLSDLTGGEWLDVTDLWSELGRKESDYVTLREQNLNDIIDGIDRQILSKSLFSDYYLAERELYSKELLYWQSIPGTVKQLNDQLKQYGGYVDNGILKIADNANIPGIIATIYDIASLTGVMLELDLAELRDSINLLFTNFADVISQGLSGELNNTSKLELIKFAKSSLGVLLKETDFSVTTNGIKLSVSAAMLLYNHLLLIDAAAAQITFDSLRESLLGAGEDCLNISATMASIARIQLQINANVANGVTDNSDLQQRLQLYQDIAKAQMQEADQYDFMSRSLPDYLKAVLNYWNSVGKAYKVMNLAAQKTYFDNATGQKITSTKPEDLVNATGYNLMGLQDFYNLATELGNLAQITGQPLMFFGQRIEADADAAAKLIEMGLSHLRNIDGEGVMVDLGAFAMNMTASVLDGTANFEDAIHAMADSQIQMLDGMIAVLLTVVAMEKLGNIDADKDMVILLPLIYFSQDGKTYDAQHFNPKFQSFAQEVIGMAQKSPLLLNSLSSILIQGVNKQYNLLEILQEVDKGNVEIVREIGQDTFSQLMTSLYQMAKSGDWDPNNLAQSFNQIATNAGLNAAIQLSETQQLRIAYGVQAVITKNDENKYVYNGKSYDSPDQAFMAARLLAAGALLNYDFTENGGKGTFEIKSTINEEAILTVEVNINGDEIEYTIIGKDGARYSGKSKQQALREYFKKLVAGQQTYNGEDLYTLNDYLKWLFTLFGLVSADLYAKEVKIEKPEKFKLATQEQINKLVNDLLSGADAGIIQGDLTEIGIQYQVTAGVDGKVVSSDVDTLLTFLGKKLQTIAMVMTGAFSGENQEALQKIFKGEEIPVKLKFDSESSSDDVQAVLKALLNAGTNTDGLRSKLESLNNEGKGYTVEIIVDPDSKASTAITEVKTKAEGLDKTFTSVYTFSNQDGSMRLLYTAEQRINNIDGQKETIYTFYDDNGKAVTEIKLVEKNINGIKTYVNTVYSFDDVGNKNVMGTIISDVKLLDNDITTKYFFDSESGDTDLTTFKQTFDEKTGGMETVLTHWKYNPTGFGTQILRLKNNYDAAGRLVETIETSWIVDPATGEQKKNEVIESYKNLDGTVSKTVVTRWSMSLVRDSTGRLLLTITNVENLDKGSSQTIVTKWQYIPETDEAVILETIRLVNSLGEVKETSTIYTFNTDTGLRRKIGIITTNLAKIKDPSNNYELSYDRTDLKNKVDEINEILEGIGIPPITFDNGNFTVPTIPSNNSNSNNDDSENDSSEKGFTDDTNQLLWSREEALNTLQELSLQRQSLISKRDEAENNYTEAQIKKDLAEMRVKVLEGEANAAWSTYKEKEDDESFKAYLTAENALRLAKEELDGYISDTAKFLKEKTEASSSLHDTELTMYEVAENVLSYEKQLSDLGYKITPASFDNLYGFDVNGGSDNTVSLAKETNSTLDSIDDSITQILNLSEQSIKDKVTSLQGLMGSNKEDFNIKDGTYATKLAALLQENGGKGVEVAGATVKTDFNFLSAITEAQQATEATNEASLSANAMAQSIASSTADSASAIENLSSIISNIPSNGAGKIYNLISAINSIPYRKLIEIIATILVKTKAAGEGASATVAGQIPDKGKLIKIAAKGNVALAGGNQKTLMGLLGPELVVANGQYNVVGQNGAEMVDLPRDAIVFNHLQTRKLLNGGTGGHGKPITNLRVAVSLATGTVGPAFASASAALAALKQIRAMWQAMRDASAKDLGSMAGKLAAGDSGGNGGGGGGKDGLIKASTAEIERWYNLTRQIDKLLQDITHQQTLRDKLDSDRIANGKAIYESRKLLLNNLMKQITATKELVFLQKSWYDRKRALLEASSYGKIFTYNENGLQQYTSGAGRGLDILEKLTLRDVNGKLLNNAESARKQIEYLKSIGFNIEDLKYNDDGTVIDFKNKGDKSDDDLYLEMMLNFWSAVDGWKELLDSLYDSYRESNESILLLESNINGLLKEVVDNQRLVEDAVVKAIEDREQAIIDKLQDLRDAILEASQKYIDGLQDSLDRLKQMYLSNQEEEDLNKLRRQILILQRTGGSGAQIGSLQNELNSKERDAYFNEQQATIDAIQQASDKELLRLDAQLDLMNDTLEYQKEHGLLWQEVTSIMSQNEEDILNFLLVNTSEYQSYSSIQMEELKLELQKQLGQWVGYRDDFSNYWQGINLQFTTVKGSIEGMDQRLWKTTDAAMMQIFGKDAWLTYADDAKEVFDQILGRTGDETKAQLLATLGADGLLRTPDGTVIGTTGTGTPTSGTGKGERGGSGGSRDSDGSGEGKAGSYDTPGWDLAIKTFSSETVKGIKKGIKTTYIPIDNQYHNRVLHYEDGTTKSFKLSHNFKTIASYKGVVNKECINCGKRLSEVYGYSSGGIVDFTGPAMLHGSKDKPLAVLNPLQTRFLREDFLSGANTLYNTLLALEAVIQGSANSTTYNSIDHGETITILNAAVNVHVDSIANDYDASRIGDMAVERMIGIARKSGSRSVSRR